MIHFMDANSLISLINSNISAIEHSEPSAAYKAINSALFESSDKILVEMIPTLEGKIVSLLLSNKSISSLHENILKNSAHTSHRYLENIPSDCLKIFYHLHKPEFKGSVAIIEIENLVTLLELLCLAHKSKLEVLDHKNSRGFLCNTLYISASAIELNRFIEENKNKIKHSQVLKDISPSLLSFFSFTEP